MVAQVLDREARRSRSGWTTWSGSTAFVRLVREQEFPDGTLTLRYGFVHVLYQNALYAALQPTRKAAWSAAAARALLGHYGEKSADLAAELAMLFEAARDLERAAEHYLVAAENAARIFAHHEAVALARRGLALLQTLPDTLDRARRELPLLVTLGVQLQVAQGYATPEAERIYARARMLCEHGRQQHRSFRCSGGFGCFTMYALIYGTRELADQLFTLAEKAQDPVQLLQAREALATTSFSVGDQAATAITWSKELPCTTASDTAL